MNNLSYSYIHIPFCDHKCSYCRFASLGVLQEKMIEKYVSYLCDQIHNPPSVISNNKSQEDLLSLYFGGGTPSSLKTEQLSQIIKAMKEVFHFSKSMEITLESTPDNINKKRIEGWIQQGINRLSIGVQSLNDQALQEIGRGQSQIIFQALDTVEQSDFDNVSVDFILGLPHVKKGETLQNIKKILETYSKIKHVSVYMLEDYYESSKLENDSKFENITYPKHWQELGIGEEEYLDEYAQIFDYLESQGFMRYEISNFAQKGYECKHNQAYWSAQKVYAYGFGAHGYVHNTRYGFPDDFKKYYSGELDYCEEITPRESKIEQLMIALRTGGINKQLQELCDKNKLNYFRENGYLEEKQERLCLTHKGVLIMDYILSEIID